MSDAPPVPLPPRIDLPFFAYGVFKPGELAYHSIANLVAEVTPSTVEGSLRIRDGLPLLDTEDTGSVRGFIVRFRPEQERDGYVRIAALETDRQYRWAERLSGSTIVNVLVGKSPRNGSVPADDDEWDGSHDDLFTTALSVVEQTLEQHEAFKWDLRPFFHIQMAYLLLWSSIERYVSLRYHLGDKVTEKVEALANEEAFIQGVSLIRTHDAAVYRSDRPTQKVATRGDEPLKRLRYYYQLRSNIAHRGKGVVTDHARVLAAARELLIIFRSVLAAAFRRN
jgi:hypothetical protein